MARKIIKVEAVETYTGIYEEIDIELDNRNIITINLKSKQDDPLIAEVLREQFIPKTDGGRVYWYNGASMTLEEVVTMLRTDDSGGNNQI